MQLTNGLKNIAAEFGITLQTCVRGSMFGFFFNQNPVENFEDALKSDTELFGKFHQGMLERGVYFAASQFETGFICVGMNEAMIDEVLGKAKEVFLEIGTYGK